MSADRQIRQASNQTIKNEQCESNAPKGMPQANSHSTWALASQGGYLSQFANCKQRYATYLQREIRTVPMRSEDCDTRLGDRGFLRARAGVTAGRGESDWRLGLGSFRLLQTLCCQNLRHAIPGHQGGLIQVRI